MQNGTAAATLSNSNHIIQANTQNGSVLFQKDQQLRETTAETAHQREPAAPVTPDTKTEAMICRIADHYRACDVTEGFLPQSDTFATRAVHSGVEKELPHGAVVPAITISSTYKMSPDGKMGVSILLEALADAGGICCHISPIYHIFYKKYVLAVTLLKRLLFQIALH